MILEGLSDKLIFINGSKTFVADGLNYLDRNKRKNDIIKAHQISHWKYLDSGKEEIMYQIIFKITMKCPQRDKSLIEIVQKKQKIIQSSIFMVQVKDILLFVQTVKLWSPNVYSNHL